MDLLGGTSANDSATSTRSQDVDLWALSDAWAAARSPGELRGAVVGTATVSKGCW